MERTHNLNEFAIELVAEHYPHLHVLHTDIIQGSGIKVVVKIETSEGTLCLKRLRKAIPIVKFTTAAQAYLAKKGALVPEIIPTKDGQLYFIHEGYALVLYKWIDGTDLNMDEDPNHLLAGIRGLAQFQSDSAGFKPPDDCEVYDRMGKWPEYYVQLTAELDRWKAKADRGTTEIDRVFSRRAGDILDMARHAQDLLQASCYAEWVDRVGPYGYLCHQDYGKGNALQTAQGVYVLDLDNLAYELPTRDLRKLISKRMQKLGRWNSDEMQAMIGCFETVLPLSAEQKRVLYIDLLFPHLYYDAAKTPFKKGELDFKPQKLESLYWLELDKLGVLESLL